MTELTQETFELCMKKLVDLPFKRTDKDVEPNMITVQRKKDPNSYVFQIWREPDEDYAFGGTFGYINPKTFKLNEKCFDGRFTIELCHGVNPVEIM